MSVQDDNVAGEKQDQQPTEKPEPDEEDKKKASEMMKVYDQDQPTLVLPGSGGMVSGTAVNEWLDEDGNPKYGVPEDAKDDDAMNEQIEKDKALNEELKKASAAENKGEKD
jgi:hypothetical protein